MLKCMSHHGTELISEKTWELETGIPGVVRVTFWLPWLGHLSSTDQ